MGALTFTPRQFSQRADFYHQLGQLTAAGLGLIRALELLGRNPPGRSYRQSIHQLLTNLGGGFTLTESCRRLGQWLPAFDIALLQAGEQSGRLDASFRLLADYYNDRARLARQFIADLVYPACLFHLAVFIIPFVQAFLTGDWLGYLCRTFGILIPLYAVVALLIYAGQSRRGEAWRARVESLLHLVPVLGAARRSLALARLAGALEALISAGVSIIESWELASAASGSPALRRAVMAWRPLLDAGRTPSEVVGACPQFPELFSSQYATGEISGKLDETLRRLHQYYLEDGSRKLHAVSQWTPRVIYLLVALMIAWYVVRFWTNHFNQISNAGGF